MPIPPHPGQSCELQCTLSPEFVAYAKENVVTFGTTGNGTDDHILMTKLNDALGLDLLQVPSPGWADNSAAIQGGHIDATASNVGEVKNLLEDGEIIVLCVFAKEVNPLIPDVPTFDSFNLTETSITNASQRGYAIKAGTDQVIVDRLVEVFEAAITNPEHIAEMEKLGLKVDYIAPDEYKEILRVDESTLLSMAESMGWDIKK